MTTNEIKLIIDEKLVLHDELKKLKALVEQQAMILAAMKFAYTEKKKRYEQIDKSRALVDGRLKVVEAKKKDGNRTINQITNLTQDEIHRLIVELERMRDEENTAV